MPNGRCRLHGGLSTGPKTWSAGGRYSKKAQAVFARIRARASDDPDLFDLRPAIALLHETRDALLARGIDQGDTPDFRKNALRMAKGARANLRQSEAPGLAVYLDELIDLLDAGVSHDQVLLEASRVAERTATRIEAARALELRETETVTLRQLGDLLDTVYAAVIEEGGERAPRIMHKLEQIYLTRAPAVQIPAEVKP